MLDETIIVPQKQLRLRKSRAYFDQVNFFVTVPEALRWTVAPRKSLRFITMALCVDLHDSICELLWENQK